MKALRLLGPNELHLEEIERPALPIGWCRIRVLAVGVCGSDISSIAGRLVFTKFPVTPGHEFSGMIIETNQCKNFKEGMFVTANPIFSCGECSECQKGNINHCTTTEVAGVNHYEGAYAEEIILPENMLFALPDHISEEQGAMIEAVNVAARALSRGNVGVGSKVAVFGAGNIGLLVIRIAKLYGAEKVLAIDPVEARLQTALQMGADEVISSAELPEKLNNYSAQFSHIIDGVGIQATMDQAVTLVAPGGSITVYGVPAGTYPVPVLDAFKKDVTINTSRLYPHNLEHAISLVASGKIDFSPMITHRCTLEDFPEISKKLVSKELDSIKVIVEVGKK